MNNVELIDELALLDDFESKAAAKRAIERVVEIIQGQLAKGNCVVVSGLGKFEARLQKGKSGKVPGTGAPYTTADKMVPKFNASKALKDIVIAGK